MEMFICSGIYCYENVVLPYLAIKVLKDPAGLETFDKQVSPTSPQVFCNPTTSRGCTNFSLFYICLVV